ncbi:MAG TPA: TonB family protein [Blastocatellia bacterium]|jgi:TonB family protein|nr:TonB family protein [Blastocatellia bacterium]
MKICPNCQQQFPDGFQYCPNDTGHLITDEEFVRRATLTGQTETVRNIPSNPTSPIAQTSNFGFSIPEQPSLISRLFAGLRSIGDSFKKSPAAPGGAAGDFQFLLREESLVGRVSRELQGAWNEFRRNPRVFVSEFARGEGSNRFRRNALLAGSELALTGFFTLYFFSQALGGLGKANPMLINLLYAGFGIFLLICFLTRIFLLYRLIYRASGAFAAPKVALEFINWTPLVALLLLSILLNNYGFYCRIFPGRCIAPMEKLNVITMLPPTVEDATKLVKAEKKPVKEKTLGGSKPKPQKASGGGGGGRQQPTPPSKGVPPQMALTPQIVLPNPEPPKIKNPTLPVAMTTYGDPSLRMPKGPIGDPTGVPAPPSSGPGTGGGIGRSSGSGVGAGVGGGAGPGRGGNIGGGDMGLGGGGSVEPMSASLRPTILYREKAKYTEEARQNKIQGVVTLQVVFHINGSITDIKVIRGLPDGLTEKAIEAAKKIRFNPAVKNGAPVSVRGTLEFTFNLY